MFIVWGEKVVYRKLGHVADFCPICRAPKTFGLLRVGLARHLYCISVGAGELIGYERRCHDCGTTLETEAERYAQVAKKRAPIPELIRTTYPQLEAVYGEQLALEAQIGRDPTSLSDDERCVLISHPFILMAMKMEQRFARTYIDKELGLACAAGLAILMFAPVTFMALLPDEDIGNVFFASIAVALGLVAWQAIAARPRFVRRAVLPALVTALRPLAPTLAELESIAESVGTQHQTVGRINLPLLQARLADATVPK